MSFQRRSFNLATSLLLIATLLLAALGGGSVAVAAETPTLIQIIDTSIWSKPSPDPSGITYWPARDTLVIADGEVDEMPIFAGANIFESTRLGAFVAGYDITNFNNEAVGIDIDVAPNGHFFISNDSAKTIFDIDLGPDGQFDTSDDAIRSFRTDTFGNTDPEGLTLGAGKLYTVDGGGQEVYVTDAGSGGIFGDGNDTTTHFDVAAIGIGDPEGIDYDPVTGTLYVVDRKGKRVSEITTTGTLIRTIDMRPWGALNPGDLTLAPSSVGAGGRSLYVAARGVDNNADPNENDGKIYEISIGTAGGDTTPPTVTSRAPAPDATGIGLATNVTATFSEAVTGVDSTSFKLEAPGGALIAAQVTYDSASRTATLDPDVDLSPGTIYKAQLTGAIKDAADNGLSPLEWSFTTAAQDTTQPTVTDRLPGAGAANVDVSTNVTAIFSENVVGVSASSFTLTQQGGAGVAAQVTYDSASRTATLNPDANLEADATYIVQLTGAIADAAGNSLEPVSWSFTTRATPPPPNNLLANPGLELDADNNGRPDVWGSNSKFTRLCAPNIPSPGAHEGVCVGRFNATDGSSATVSQSISNLAAGTTYSFSGWVNIPAPIAAVNFKLQVRWLNSAGSTISTRTVRTYTAATSGWNQATFSEAAPAGTAAAQVRLNVSSLNGTLYVDDLQFTGGAPAGDTTPPTVAGRTPASGATGVAIGTSVTATFSEDVQGVSGTTFKLTPQAGGAAVSAVVSYDAAAKKATLVPSSPLAANTPYNAQLVSGITDLAGNPLAPASWSFTTATGGGGGPTFTFAAVADTYVSQSSPTGSFATAKELQSVGGASSAKITYIRFTVSGLPAGAVVQSAKLRLSVTNDSTSGGIFNTITNNTWAENINWNAKPAIDGQQLASLGAVAINATVEVDVTVAITGNGTYSFAISHPATNTNTLGYASKEHTTVSRRPQLVITTQ